MFAGPAFHNNLLSITYSFLQIPPRDGHPCCSAMYFVVAYAYSGLSPVRARPWRANQKEGASALPRRTRIFPSAFIRIRALPRQGFRDAVRSVPDRWQKGLFGRSATKEMRMDHRPIRRLTASPVESSPPRDPPLGKHGTASYRHDRCGCSLPQRSCRADFRSSLKTGPIPIHYDASCWILFCRRRHVNNVEQWENPLSIENDSSGLLPENGMNYRLLFDTDYPVSFRRILYYSVFCPIKSSGIRKCESIHFCEFRACGFCTA